MISRMIEVVLISPTSQDNVMRVFLFIAFLDTKDYEKLGYYLLGKSLMVLTAIKQVLFLPSLLYSSRVTN